MPKRQTQRIIDSRRRNTSATIIGATGSGAPVALSAGDGLVLTGTTLDVVAGDGVSVAADSIAVNSTVVRTTRTVTAGSGLTGGGALSADLTLNVGAGTLLTVGADSVGITAGSNYQYIGTGSGTAAAWQNLSGLAGNGLTHSAGVLAVGAGSGLTVNADDVALTTPGTLTASTSNAATGNHTHAITTGAASTLSVSTSNAAGSSASLARADHLHTITSNSNPGAAASILASSAAGLLQLVQVSSNATFASGFAGSGYRVDYGVSEASKASAEFDNLTVRGRMRVYELLIQQIRATNGSVFVSSSSKAAMATANADPLWTVNGVQLTLNGVNATLDTTLYTITTSTADEASASRTHYHGFLYGDIIRAQQVLWDGSSFAGVIQSNLEVTGVTNLYTYQAAMVSGDAPAAGYDYVRLGSATSATRQGTIYLTSDDSNAPFIDIVDGVRAHSEWNAAGKVKTRVGKLSGITDAVFGTLSGYGLYSDNVYLKGSVYATSGYFKGTIYADGGVFNGTVYATAGTFTGTVTAAAGSIGGWTIGASTLTGGNATLNSAGSLTLGTSNDVLTASAADATYRLWVGHATAASAPFSVTKGGVLYASGATISGAITASSGSITGALTIGTSGGIYQGSGTFASPTTGLKIFNVGGYGVMAGYYSGNVQWFSSSTGQLFTGYRSDIDEWSQRFASDGVRFYLEESTGITIPTNSSALRWVSGSVNDTVGGAYNYTGIIGYRNSTANVVDAITTSYVGSGSYTTQTARVILQAGNYDGSTYRDAYFYVSKAAGAGGETSGHLQANFLSLSGYVSMVEISAPSSPGANGVYVYAEDNGSGKTRLMAKFSSGSAVQIAIQP